MSVVNSLRLSHRYCRLIDVCCHLPARKRITPFKNLLFNFFFAESTVLRLKVNCNTFFVVILNGICVLALAQGEIRRSRFRFYGDYLTET